MLTLAAKASAWDKSEIEMTPAELAYVRSEQEYDIHDEQQKRIREWRMKTLTPNPKTAKAKDELHVGLDIPKQAAIEVYNWVQEQDWPKGTELEPLEDYHITMLFSQSDGASGHRDDDWIEHDSHAVTVKSVKEFPPSEERNGLHPIVLFVDSDTIHDHHDKLAEGAEAAGVDPGPYSKDKYQPHMTVAYGPGLPKGLKPPKLTFETAESSVSTPREEKEASVVFSFVVPVVALREPPEVAPESTEDEAKQEPGSGSLHPWRIAHMRAPYEVELLKLADSWNPKDQWPNALRERNGEPVDADCTCKDEHKLDCPVHGMHPELPTYDDTLEFPNPASPVGYDYHTDAPRTWMRAETKMANEISPEDFPFMREGCGDYAEALKEAHPHLKFGMNYNHEEDEDGDEVLGPVHAFVHDGTHAYDALGQHPLPYNPFNADHTEYDVHPDDIAAAEFRQESGEETPQEHIKRRHPYFAANAIGWTRGNRGKGLVAPDGTIFTWNVDKDGQPHHGEYMDKYHPYDLNEGHAHFFQIRPRGGLDTEGYDLPANVIRNVLQADTRLKAGEHTDWHFGADTADTREYQDSRMMPPMTQAPGATNPHPEQQGCTCDEGHKLDCPVHGLEPTEQGYDHTWSIPEGHPVGYPQDQPRNYMKAEGSAGDGDGYVQCQQGHHHWGRNGAAGLMLRHVDETGQPRYLLTHRSPAVMHGDTYSVPGGALDSHETPEEGALREAQEELGPIPGFNPTGMETADHGGWAYHTVHGDVPRMFTPRPQNWETQSAQWHTPEEIDQLPLHPGFQAYWEGRRHTAGWHFAGETLPQQMRRWQDLRPHPRSSRSKVVHTFPDNWTVQDHQSKFAVQAVGQMMRNCWQGKRPNLNKDGALISSGRPGIDAIQHFMALHDENDIPRVAFYVNEFPGKVYVPGEGFKQGEYGEGESKIRSPWGFRNKRISDSHAERLQDFARQHGISDRFQIPEELPPEQDAGVPAMLQAPVNLASAQSPWWHITDNPNFDFDPEHTLNWNSTMGNTGDEPPGMFITQNPEYWFNGHDYVRPYAAEIEAPEHALEPGYMEQNDRVLPAHAYPQSRIKRVIPIDEYAREQYGEPGWIESNQDYEGVSHHDMPRYPDYRYEGPDVREMSPEEHAHHEQRVQRYIEDVRPHMLDTWDENGERVPFRKGSGKESGEQDNADAYSSTDEDGAKQSAQESREANQEHGVEVDTHWRIVAGPPNPLEWIIHKAIGRIPTQEELDQMIREHYELPKPEEPPEAWAGLPRAEGAVEEEDEHEDNLEGENVAVPDPPEVIKRKRREQKDRELVQESLR